MTRMLFRTLKWIALQLALLLAAVLAWSAFSATRGPPLELWHTVVPHEMTATQIDQADWKAYLAAEARVIDEVRAEVTDKLPPEARIDSNRYFADSPIYPGRFEQDWNRSYVLSPAGAPRGAVVLRHGLTDSPYSLRHSARRYTEDGFVAVAARMPGHGTVPGGLSTVEWEQWTAATRLAVRHARQLAGLAVPLHIVGFSNGGALAMKYALEALEDKSLAHPARIVLLSPMIGVTSMARFAGVVGWPAFFPAFANAAWLGVVPEFNPFKFNSFPVNGARQSSLVARRLQAQIASHADDGLLAKLAPVLTFQSVVDFTVSTRAIVDALYRNLPANGSELVLFDLNRTAKFGPLLRRSADTVMNRLLPDAPRNFTTTVVSNGGSANGEVIERVVKAGETTEQVRALGLHYPREVFSLSHLALPFPLSDSLYGMQPEDDEFGVNLGAMATRGERGILVITQDSLARMSSNPFFPYLMQRVEQVIEGAAQ